MLEAHAGVRHSRSVIESITSLCSAVLAGEAPDLSVLIGAGVGETGYPNATPSPLFLGRFAPVFRRFSAVLLCCLASWRQDGENGRKMAENGRNLGEKRARNSGG